MWNKLNFWLYTSFNSCLNQYEEARQTDSWEIPAIRQLDVACSMNLVITNRVQNQNSEENKKQNRSNTDLYKK